MTRVFKPIYLDEALGELGRLPDNSIVNIGGTSSTTFTVGGRALLFEDGSSTGPSTGVGFTLQVAYGTSLVPAQINTIAGKNIVFNATNNNKLVFNADTGAVTIDGLLNGVPVADLINHINASLSPAKHSAEQISFDDSGLTNVSGSNVQAALESIDSQLTTIGVGNVVGFEYIQVAPATVWTIVHNVGSTKVQATVWDETNAAILPDAITIIDGTTVYVVFASPQAGRAVLMLF